MNYRKLFDCMHPGFFDEPGIKNIPEDRVFAELIMDLRSKSPDSLPYPYSDDVRFDVYHSHLEKIRDTVAQVDEEWPRYFDGRNRVFCAFDGDKIASFCILEDWGMQDGLRIGGPGCVGTVPQYRKKGVGLEMVRRATNILKEEGFDLSWIHYTGLSQWYEKLGYRTVLRWTGNGFLPD